MLRLLLLLALIWTPSLAAQQIQLIPPDGPVELREPVRIFVKGLTDKELLSTSVGVEPKLPGVKLDVGKNWRNEPYIEFWSKVRGKFTITASLNQFTQTLKIGVDVTEKALGDEPLVEDLKDTAGKIVAKYPTKSGTAIVQVSGEEPPDPPDPPDPPTPGTTADQLIILRHPMQVTTEYMATMIAIQEKYQKGTCIETFVLNYNDPAQRVQDYVKLKPGDKRYPYYFLIARNGSIVDKGELPNTFEKADVIIKKFCKDAQ